MPPHSPYQKTFYQPLSDRVMDSYREYIEECQRTIDNGERDKEMPQMLVDQGGWLIKQCDFLEEKLMTTVRIYLPHGTLPMSVNGIANKACILPT